MNEVAYIVIADGDLKNSIDGVQSEIRKMVGEIPYFSQWPTHMTVSYGNSLSDEDLSIVVSQFKTIASETKPFTVSFDKNIVFTKKIIGDIAFYGIKLKVIQNEELLSLSKKVVSIADKFETPIKGFFKSDFHLTIMTTPDIEEGQFDKIEEELSKFIFDEKMTVDSFSIVSNGQPYKGYPTMDQEIANFKFNP